MSAGLWEGITGTSGREHGMPELAALSREAMASGWLLLACMYECSSCCSLMFLAAVTLQRACQSPRLEDKLALACCSWLMITCMRWLSRCRWATCSPQPQACQLQSIDAWAHWLKTRERVKACAHAHSTCRLAYMHMRPGIPTRLHLLQSRRSSRAWTKRLHGLNTMLTDWLCCSILMCLQNLTDSR